MKEALLFFLCLLGINFLVFLPHWIIGLFLNINPRNKAETEQGFTHIVKTIIYKRFTNDFFRFSAEIQVLIILFLISNVLPNYFKIAITVMATFGFVYVTYISSIISVFKKDPILTNDIEFAKTGFMAYRNKAKLALFSAILVTVIVSVCFYFLTDLLISTSLKFHYKGFILCFIVMSLALSAYSIKKMRYDFYMSAINFSIIRHFILNLNRSHQLKNSLKSLNYQKPYSYVNEIKPLKHPNIIFLSLESYGEIALQDEKVKHSVIEKLKQLDKVLQKKGWLSASTLSKSPISSGGSWISHSCLFYGAKVKDNAAHDLIYTKTDFVSQLESLPKFFKNHGYKTTSTATLSYNQNEVNWEKVNNLYPFDELMLIEDFDYKGKTVPIFGNRDTLPDEYTLNYAYQKHLGQSPFFLFVNTTNSHYSFHSPTKALEDWNAYNSEDFQLTDGLKKNAIKNYTTAINYHFDYLEKFILNNDLDDTIIVLFGDHQPPFITNNNSNKDTPIHIISKNETFVNAFEYKAGLIPEKRTQNHEAFFSVFLNAFNKAYGSNPELETPIFKDGINLY